jgi:hypothetical protein
MVAKCTNPSCSVSFRSLEKGKLFRLEADTPLSASTSNRAEYFWLCDHCSSTMTLHLSENGSVMPIVLAEPVHNGGDFISANRQKGLLLSRVSFRTERHRGDMEFVG